MTPLDDDFDEGYVSWAISEAVTFARVTPYRVLLRSSRWPPVDGVNFFLEKYPLIFRKNPPKKSQAPPSLRENPPASPKKFH